LSTVLLSNIPEYNREVGIPRTAAIEYPFGRFVGQVNDREGQRSVLLKALEVFETASKPGDVFHLPFTWPEKPEETDWQPAEPSPIIKMFKKS
jgi:hypothetical protein